MKLYWIKIGILVFVNILCLVGIFQTANFLSIQAAQAQKIRQNNVLSQTSSQQVVLQSELDKYKTQADSLENLFPDDTTVVNFVLAISDLKSKGQITDFAFSTPNSTPVKDNLGLLGIPISITIDGDINTINSGLQSVNSLPYLIRPLVLDIEAASQSGQLEAQYGGFLYVDQNYGKN